MKLQSSDNKLINQSDPHIYHTRQFRTRGISLMVKISNRCRF